MSQPPGVPGSTEPPPEETAVPADSAGSATGSARSDPGSAGPVAVPHQEAHVGGGGSVYQAGRDQVFRYEDGVHGLSRAEPGSPSAECPYPGLAAFGPDLARWFFGRDQAVAQLSEELAGRLDRGGALMVIGPSGAGKSSLLQAGLIPALDRGVLPAAGSSDWPHDVFTPTASPLAELAECLERLTGVAVDCHSAGAAQAAEEDVAAIRRVVEQGRAGRTPDTRVILIMDQFEEVFALCPHEQERQAFVSLLAELAAPSPGGASAAALVVLGMRADFYAQAAQYPQLREVMRDGLVLLDPLSRSELRQAIIYPARDVGLDIEPGLVEILLRDLGVNDRGDGPAAAQATPGDGAGRLPLLAHALRVTWQQRQGHLLTVEGYQASGGIQRAVATTAEQAYRGFTDAEQEVARSLFLRMITVGDGSGDTSRRMARADLFQDLGDVPAATAVVGAFTQRRLLTQEQDTVSITHDALLHAWPRLRDWISSDRAGNLVRQDLDAAAIRWERDAHDAGALYRSGRLAAARAWAATHSGDLTDTMRAFLAASIHQEHQAARNRRTAITLLAVLTLLALATAGVALQQRASAQAASHQAIQQRDQAVFSQVSAEATQLEPTNPSLAAQLNLVAYHMRRTPELYTSLVSAQNSVLSSVLSQAGGPIQSVAYSPDGRLIASAGLDGLIRLSNVSRPAHPVQAGPPLDSHSGILLSVAFSPRGHLLASAGKTVRLWNVADPARPVPAGPLLDRGDGGTTAVAFSPGGELLASASGAGAVRLWNVTDPAHPAQVGPVLDSHNGTVWSVAFSPDGRVLATGSYDGTVRLWDVGHPAHAARAGPPLRGATNTVHSVAFSPDGTTLAAGSLDGTIRLWNVAHPAQPHQIGRPLNSQDLSVFSVAFSPDGHLLASGNSDDTIRLWNVSDLGNPHLLGLPFAGQSALVASVAFSPGGSFLASGSWDKTTRLWSIPPTVAATGASVDSLAYRPDGRILASGNFGGAIQFWKVSDPGRLISIGPPIAGNTREVKALAYSPDGRILASGSLDTTIRLWNVSDPARPVPIGRPLPGGTAVHGLAFSRDGHVLASSSASTDQRPGMVRLWNVSDPARPLLLGAPLRLSRLVSGDAVVFSHSSRILAAQSSLSVQLWNVTDPARPILVGNAPAPGTSDYSVALSPDGRILADSGFANTIQLWNVADPHRPRPLGQPLTGHTNTVTAIAFSPDSRVMVSGGLDETLRLWHVSDRGGAGSIGGPLTGDTSDIWSAAWSPTHDVVASGSGDTTVRLWNLNAASAERWVCGSTSNTLTRAEWKKYIPELPYKPPCAR